MEHQAFIDFMDSYNVSLRLNEKPSLELTLLNRKSLQPVYVQRNSKEGWIQAKYSSNVVVIYFNDITKNCYNELLARYSGDMDFYDLYSSKVAFLVRDFNELLRILTEEYEVLMS